MQYPDRFSNLSLMAIPLDERSCVFRNEFLLADNLDEAGSAVDLTADPGAKPFITSPYPFKIQFWMAMLCLGGRMRVQLNLFEYELGENDVLIIEEGSIGQVRSISADCRLVVIASSSPHFVPEASTREAISIRLLLSASPLIRLAPADVEETLGLYRLMRRKIQQSGYRYTREALRGYMQVLFCNCCQLASSRAEAPQAAAGGRQEELFGRFMELLKEHYTRERSIAFYADKLCITPKYLSQSVCHASGRRAGEWIRDYVILEAKALLKSRKYTVQQVSEMLHLPNQSFFGAYFRKSAGCSPRAYQMHG